MSEAEGYIKVLGEQFDELAKAIGGLDPVALNWQPPAPGTNSVFALATHTVGGAAFWIQQVVGGVDIGRDRAAEFRAAGNDLTAWNSRLAAVRARNEEVLRAVSPAEFDRMLTTAMGTFSARWCVLHVVDHTSRHIGHIELTRQLWEARAGSPP